MRRWFEEIYSDFSAITLIISNLLVAFLAILDNWSVLTLMWIFLLQAIIITVFKIVPLTRHYYKSKSNINSEQFRQIFSKQTMILIAVFGMYIIMLLTLTPNFPGTSGSDPIYIKIFNQPPKLTDIIISTVIFLINHIYSFIYNKDKNYAIYQSYRGMSEEYNDSMFKAVFIRTLPLHLTPLIGIIFGTSIATIIGFLTIKLILDVNGHIKMLRFKPKATTT